MRPVKLIILFCLSTNMFAQTSPNEWFGTQYTDALQFCESNKVVIENTCRNYKLSPVLTISIVFPEMLRYTMWRNILETRVLEFLYVSGGSASADFSIGWMQMKPSFAERIEKDLKQNTQLKVKYSSLIYYSNTDTIAMRSIRVERLKSFDFQLKYLSAFIEIAQKKYYLNGEEAEQKLALLAAAYNRGITCSKQELIDFYTKRTFPYGPGKDNPFSYAGLATYFFNGEGAQIFN